MANPSKVKGTQEESRIVDRWNLYCGDVVARRMPANSPYDIHVGPEGGSVPVIEVLSMRADRGGALYVLREDDFIQLFASSKFYGGFSVHQESKRYARTAVHAIFTKKFGSTKCD
jgi:hypothetical protein